MSSDIIDLDEIATLFRVTPEAVRKWTHAGLPVEKRGKRGRGSNKTQISLRAAVEWYFSENYERLELDRARTRHSAEQADKLALENAERRGDLGELSVWQKELEKFLVELRTALLGLPTKVAPRLDGDINQRKDRLEQAIHEVLRSLSTYQSEHATPAHARADQSVSDDPETAPETDREPVGGREAAPVERKQRRARRVEN